MDYVTGSGRVLDCVYLDCTFGAEPMVMPSKEEAIEQVHSDLFYMTTKTPRHIKSQIACCVTSVLQ